MPFLEEVQKRWFLFAIVVVISLAKLTPFIGAIGGVCVCVGGGGGTVMTQDSEG